jgi:hypothetical protein
MKFLLFIIIFFLAGNSSGQYLKSQPVPLAHDLSIDKLISPYQYMAPGYSDSVIIQISNQGTVTETNITAIASIHYIQTQYVDTVVISSIAPGKSYRVAFKKIFMPIDQTIGSIGYPSLILLTGATDENPSNDTLRTTITVNPHSDLKAISITNPLFGEAKPRKIGFRISGLFSNIGSDDKFHVQVDGGIYSKKDNTKFFEIGGYLDAVLAHSPSVELSLPIESRTMMLPVGDYRVILYIKDKDENPIFAINDTSYSEFSIAPTRLTHDIRMDAAYPNRFSIIPVDSAVIPIVYCTNDGSSFEPSVPIRFQIFTDSILYSKIVITPMDTGSNQVIFPAITLPPGIYHANSASLLFGDQFLNDDKIESYDFKVGFNFDANIQRITAPQDSEICPVGSLSHIKGMFRWLDIPPNFIDCSVNAQILSLKTNDVVCTMSTFISKTSITGPDPFEIVFPAKQNGFSMDQLPIGKYRIRMIANSSFDENHKNDTCQVSFQIGSEELSKNLAILFSTPIDSALIKVGTPFSISGKYFNSGKAALSNSYGIVLVRTLTDSLCFSDTIAINYCESGKVSSFNSKLLTLTKENVFKIVTKVFNQDDNYHSDDSIEQYISTYTEDVAAVSIVEPGPHSQCKAGSFIAPKGVFHLGEIWHDVPYVPVQIQILDSVTNQMKYEGFTAIPILHGNGQNQQIIFPSTIPGLEFSNITNGSYKMYMITLHSEDLNHFNDTASTYFSIYGSSSVNNSLPNEVGNLLLSNHPNPFFSTTSFDYTLPEAGKISLRIIDITGKIIQQYESAGIETEGQHIKSISMDAAPNGMYVAELTHLSISGKTSNIRVLISHIN